MLNYFVLCLKVSSIQIDITKNSLLSLNNTNNLEMFDFKHSCVFYMNIIYISESQYFIINNGLLLNVRFYFSNYLSTLIFLLIMIGFYVFNLQFNA